MVEEYKILVFSDMHGNRRVVDLAKTILGKDDFDMAVYLGDFSERIGDVKANIEDAEHMIAKLGGLAEFKALFGNCDTPELAQFLEDQGVSLHDKTVFKGKTALVGRGGSHPTPFHTPSEFSEAEIEEALERSIGKAADNVAEKLVLFSHEPPANTKADRLPTGNVGSEAIRHIIEKHQPNLNVCGHIHEAKSTDMVRGTKVINIGPSSDGHFLVLRIDGEIAADELSI